MKNREHRHGERGDEHLRQMNHQGGRYALRKIGEKTRNNRAHADGNDEIQNSENVPGNERPAGCKTRPVRQRECDPRRGKANRHIAQRSWPGEIAGQKAGCVKREETEPGPSPRLDSGQQPQIGFQNEVAE